MSKAIPTDPPHRSGKADNPVSPLLEARKKLEQAERLRLARKLNQAQKICETVLKQYPDYVGILHTLGLVLADKRKYHQAVPHLVHATMLNPRDSRPLIVLAGVYLRLGAREMAVRTLEQARQRQPEDANILAILGEIHRDDREYQAAANAYCKALDIDPSLYDVQTGLGSVCIHLGRFQEAAAAFLSLMEHYSDSINLLFSLSQLPPSLINLDLLSLVEGAAPRAGESRERFETVRAFTKAGALHNAGRHHEAWTSLVEANSRMLPDHRDAWRKDAKIQEVILAGAKKHQVVTDKPRCDADGQPMSLFIIGPSRSGKTTTELLVSTIDGVKRGYENPIVENVIRHTFQTAGLPTRDWMIELPPGLDDLCRDFYLEELEERAGTARIFTNTHPGHITSVLRIANTLPNVRFVFVKRDIDDITFRIFMKKYRSGNAHSYDLGTIREYITWYYEMIDVLAEKLPHLTTVIQYEEMIANPATALKSVVKLCAIEDMDGPPLVLENDRGCAAPYRQLMTAALID